MEEIWRPRRHKHERHERRGGEQRREPRDRSRYQRPQGQGAPTHAASRQLPNAAEGAAPVAQHPRRRASAVTALSRP